MAAGPKRAAEQRFRHDKVSPGFSTAAETLQGNFPCFWSRRDRTYAAVIRNPSKVGSGKSPAIRQPSAPPATRPPKTAGTGPAGTQPSNRRSVRSVSRQASRGMPPPCRGASAKSGHKHLSEFVRVCPTLKTVGIRSPIARFFAGVSPSVLPFIGEMKRPARPNGIAE